LLSAQYGGGSTSSYSVNPDGSLKERVEKIEHGEGTKVNPRRQEAAHPHWVGTSPDNRFVFVPDLGADRVFAYELDAEQASLKLHSKIPVPPGSGPRHMKFHTTGKYVYVLNELALTISVFEYDAEKAEFKDIQLIKTLSEEAKAKEKQNTAAEIRVHPSGKFVYSSNRGHDSISVFSVDQATGKLTLVEQVHVRGAWPRNFNLDPSGKWLIAAGQNSNTLSLFEVDQESGKLTYTQKTVNVPAPICVLFENE
jgi:6-phosphogluconolactonase